MGDADFAPWQGHIAGGFAIGSFYEIICQNWQEKKYESSFQFMSLPAYAGERTKKGLEQFSF
jgi:hypothetical protein